MKNQKSGVLLSALFMAVAVFLCPLVHAFLGLEFASANDTMLIYSWVGSVLFLLLALLELPAPSVFKRINKYGIAIILAFTCFEFGSALAHRILTGEWAHTIEKNYNQFLFEEHSELVGSLIKNAHHTRGNLTYAHNSQGYRGEEFAIQKPKGTIRIVTIGGSTTYGVGVNNEETWPYHLSQLLGDAYEVINMGVPGYSSLENRIQTELYLAELQPDLVIFHVGLNDLRNMNIENLAEDYSDFHRPSLYGAFGLCQNENLPGLASLRLLVMLGQTLDITERCHNQQIAIKTKPHNGVDIRALAIYKQNLVDMISNCHKLGIEALFVPQILLEDVLKSGDYTWWIPYVPLEEMDDMMHVYNQATQEVAESNEAQFLSEVSAYPWSKNDFVDLSHFTNSANLEFARIIAEDIQATQHPTSDQNE